MKTLYLITGATGHLGSVLLESLRARGASLRALVRPGSERLLPPGTAYTNGDVTDPASLGAFFAREEVARLCLLHCAGRISIATKPDPAVWEVNVTGTRNVLCEALRRGVERAVCVSSVHAIPERPAGELITETKRFSPALVVGQYARAKAAAARLALEAAEAGLDLSVVHPSGILGPGDRRRENHSVQTLRAMAAGRLPACIEGGYDFVDVRDVADGILRCAERGRRGETYILSGRYAAIRELAELVAAATGRPAPRLTVPAAAARLIAPAAERLALLLGGRRPLVTPYSIEALQSGVRFSFRKAAEELGYAPRALLETVRDTVLEPVRT